MSKDFWEENNHTLIAILIFIIIILILALAGVFQDGSGSYEFDPAYP